MRCLCGFRALVCLALAVPGLACDRVPADSSPAESRAEPSASAARLDFKSAEYHAVFLMNGQGLIGKIEPAEGPFLVLTDTYYVQSRVDPQTKQSSNFLVKRGNEWHGPERMFLNTAHVVLIEPVSPESSAAQTIRKIKSAAGPAPK
jgi:hypothetical protein